MRKVKIPEKEYIELIQIKARTESFIDYVKRSNDGIIWPKTVECFLGVNLKNKEEDNAGD